MKLSIIIPVFNEASTIKQIITKVKTQPLKSVIKEIIVIDDASSDGTTKILRSLSGITKVFQKTNQGKGAAIRAGIKKAQGEYILIQDADLEYDPADIPLLLEPVLTKKAVIVYGSRFLGPHKNMLFWHMLGNNLLTLLTNLFYDTTLSDMEVGYKLFPKKLYQSLNLIENRFGFEPEITSKILKQGLRIYEVPISYTGREFHEGKKITWRDGIVAFFLLLKYRLVD